MASRSRLSFPVKSVYKLSADSSLAQVIRSMLFGLGDSSKPLLTTAKMIETVLLQQMAIFLEQVEEIAMRRDSSKIEMQDIVFLMRNDKAKLTRLLNFINSKDTKGRCKTEVVSANGHIKVKFSKRTDNCLQFLKAIGITGVCDPSADDDYTSKERLVRVDITSDSLSYSTGEYGDFLASR